MSKQNDQSSQWGQYSVFLGVQLHHMLCVYSLLKHAPKYSYLDLVEYTVCYLGYTYSSFTQAIAWPWFLSYVAKIISKAFLIIKWVLCIPSSLFTSNLNNTVIHNMLNNTYTN